MKRALALRYEPTDDTSDDPIAKANAVLSRPLPSTEPERTREIARRSEKVEQILSAAAHS
jgi:hypothetical protein